MYETLLHEAEQEQVEVVYRPLRGRLKGLYYEKSICLNSNICTTAERSCILAEELGHHYTAAGNILDQKKTRNRKLERRARAWAYKKLVPLDKLIQAFIEGARTRYEMAEYLGITECFLNEAINYYKEKYGNKCRVGNHWICFEPLSITSGFKGKFNRPEVKLYRRDN